MPDLVVLVGSEQAIPVAVRAPVLRDGNVYLYSGTLLTYFNQRGTWRPFFTVGAGGITRTSKLAFVQNRLPFPVGVTTLPIISPTLVPATTRTDMALVLGVGFKKYLPHGLGARMDFRDYINKFDQSTQYGTVAWTIHSLLKQTRDRPRKILIEAATRQARPVYGDGRELIIMYRYGRRLSTISSARSR